jgi:hypothetical protein
MPTFINLLILFSNHFEPEEGGSKFLWNNGNLYLFDTLLYSEYYTAGMSSLLSTTGRLKKWLFQGHHMSGGNHNSLLLLIPSLSLGYTMYIPLHIFIFPTPAYLNFSITILPTGLHYIRKKRIHTISKDYKKTYVTNGSVTLIVPFDCNLNSVTFKSI